MMLNRSCPGQCPECCYSLNPDSPGEISQKLQERFISILLKRGIGVCNVIGSGIEDPGSAYWEAMNLVGEAGLMAGYTTSGVEFTTEEKAAQLISLFVSRTRVANIHITLSALRPEGLEGAAEYALRGAAAAISHNRQVFEDAVASHGSMDALKESIQRVWVPEIVLKVTDFYSSQNQALELARWIKEKAEGLVQSLGLQFRTPFSPQTSKIFSFLNYFPIPGFPPQHHQASPPFIATGFFPILPAGRAAKFPFERYSPILQNHELMQSLSLCMIHSDGTLYLKPHPETGDPVLTPCNSIFNEGSRLLLFPFEALEDAIASWSTSPTLHALERNGLKGLSPVAERIGVDTSEMVDVCQLCNAVYSDAAVLREFEKELE
jgi:hypothetical protein